MNGSAIHLLIIDPQNDFCDFAPETPHATSGMSTQEIRPALPVPGAHRDMLRLAGFMQRAGHRIGAIHVTLDSHHPLHIAHPQWWVDAEGRSPAPFTLIQGDDVRAGTWRARHPSWQERSRAYVESLDAGGRYKLVIWPEHCLLGQWGHNVHPAVAQELARWENNSFTTIDYVFKGSNPFTEHYSAVQAEVPDPSDPATLPNTRLIESLGGADMLIIAGEALSHCVANTVRDLADYFDAPQIERCTLLVDCTSPVAGFEAFGVDFMRELAARGMKSARSTEMLR
jgi:nicotinamidase-related amidase